MTEAVIVATARSPIGRAFKGSLTTVRPDDLTCQMVDRRPGQGAPARPGRLATSCSAAACPGGEQGFNMARVVAVMLGLDHLPGTTVTRYCSSSLQTTRMAFHAIKAGEGDVFISAGVECVSRFAKGSSDQLAGHQEPVFADAEARTDAGPARTPGLARPARGRRRPRHLHRDGADRRERRADSADQPGRSRTSSACRSQNLAEKAHRQRLLAARDHPGRPCRTAPWSADDGPRPGTTLEKVAALQPVFRPDGTVTAGNCCPLNDGAAAVVIMSDRKAADLGLTPLARIVATGLSALSPEIMGLGPVEASRRRWPGRHDHRRHRPGRDQRGVRRQVIPSYRSSASTSTS
jgi:acetyl-CoA C-acetyltransferase